MERVRSFNRIIPEDELFDFTHDKLKINEYIRNYDVQTLGWNFSNNFDENTRS